MKARCSIDMVSAAGHGLRDAQGEALCVIGGTQLPIDAGWHICSNVTWHSD